MYKRSLNNRILYKYINTHAYYNRQMDSTIDV
jgi:hypothetical protein